MGQSQQLILMAKALMLGTASFVSLGLGLGWATPALGNEEVDALGSEGVEDLESNEIAFPLPESPAGRLRQPPITPSRPADLEQPATSVAEWMAQIEASQVQITGVRLEPTETGLSIVLETPDADLPMPTTQTLGNALTAEIPNAVLTLPEGEMFEQFGPAEGIALVSVMNIPDGGVRVSITGTDAPPQAEVSTETDALILRIVPGTTPIAEDDDTIQIVVTATRTEEELANIPRAVTIVEREQIEQQANLSRDLATILSQTVPGYSPPNQTATDFAQTLRGRSPVVLIDGIPITENRGFGRDLRSIDPGAIERIEVVRGPSAVYGSEGGGGVINIITRRPSDQPFTSTVEIGGGAALGELEEDSLSNFGRLSFSGSMDQFDYLVSVSRESTGAFFDADGNRISSTRGLEDAETWNVLGRLGIDLTEDQRLQLTANYYESRQDTEFIPVANPEPGIQAAESFEVGEQEYIGGERPGNSNTVVSLDYTHDNVFGSQLLAQLYYQDFSLAFAGGEFGPIVAQTLGDSEKWGGRLQLNTSITTSLSLLWGLDIVNENTSGPINIFDGEEFFESERTVFRKVDEGFDIPPYNLNNLGLFAQADWEISDRWRVSGGIRYETIDFSVDDFTSFRNQVSAEGGDLNFDDLVFNIGTIYDVTDHVNVFASFAQGFSVPSFGLVLRTPPEGFSVNLFDLTEPIVINNYELGIRGSWSNLQASLSGFLSTSDLGADFTRNDEGLLIVSRAPEQVYGFEIALDAQLSGTWQLGTALSWLEGNFENEDGDFKALSSNRISPLNLTAYVENQTTPDWRNRLQLLYSGSRDRAFDDGVDRAPIDSYITVDYISSIQFGLGELQIGVKNLLDTEYFPIGSQILAPIVESSNIPGQGRTVSIRYVATW